MSLYSGGLIFGGIFASKIWAAYFREGLFFFSCYQALVKSGASSQTMGVDEFIVAAAEILLEQV